MTKKTQRAKARAEKKPRIGEEHIRPDGSVIRYVREEDDDQKPVDHYRTVDTLALMLRNGSITGAMHDAGQQFSQDFARACHRPAHWSHLMIGTMEPPRDRHIEASAGSA